jgi:hypothetical protein
MMVAVDRPPTGTTAARVEATFDVKSQVARKHNLHRYCGPLGDLVADDAAIGGGYRSGPYQPGVRRPGDLTEGLLSIVQQRRRFMAPHSLESLNLGGYQISVAKEPYSRFPQFAIAPHQVRVPVSQTLLVADLTDEALILGDLPDTIGRQATLLSELPPVLVALGRVTLSTGWNKVADLMTSTGEAAILDESMEVVPCIRGRVAVHADDVLRIDSEQSEATTNTFLVIFVDNGQGGRKGVVDGCLSLLNHLIRLQMLTDGECRRHRSRLAPKLRRPTASQVDVTLPPTAASRLTP